MRDQLPLYVSGRLADAEYDRVEAHLRDCADCAAEVGVLRAAVRAFEVRALDSAAISAKIPTARTAQRSRPFHRQPLWRVAAAITLMIAGTATVMVVQQNGGASPGVDTLVIAQGTAPRETAVAAGGPSVVRATATINFGNDLSDLSDAQLEALIASLDRLEGAVSAEPVSLVTPIVPDSSAGRNR
jgi:anti-sigma factor RsiW